MVIAPFHQAEAHDPLREHPFGRCGRPVGEELLDLEETLQAAREAGLSSRSQFSPAANLVRSEGTALKIRAERRRLGCVKSSEARGLWGLPLWTHNPLMFLGLWFLLLPVPLVLGLRWEFYVIGLVGAIGLGWWVRRNYRFTTLEKSESVTVVRSERRQQD